MTFGYFERRDKLMNLTNVLDKMSGVEERLKASATDMFNGSVAEPSMAIITIRVAEEEDVPGVLIRVSGKNGDSITKEI
jgi:hypothetical protein